MGGNLKQEIGKERNSIYVTVHRNDVDKAFEVLGGLINNTSIGENQLEAEREAIYRRIVDQQRDMLELTLDNVWYTSYREHQLGQPTLGVRENAANISVASLKSFVEKAHTGNNLFVTATGAVNHQQVADLAGKHFGGLRRGDGALDNSHKATYTSSLMYLRDDELSILNVGVFFRAPAYNHPDAVVMKLFAELLGDYSAEKHTANNLNDASLQYNSFHNFLGDNPDINLQKTFYFPLSDTGIFGSYLAGNEVYAPQIALSSQNFLASYANYVNYLDDSLGQPE